MGNLASVMEMLLAVSAGIGLAAACGFRVFLPLLAASLAVNAGFLNPSPGLLWIGSQPVVILLAVATVLEILGYYIPWVDHALDTVATPAAIVAGAIVAATAFGDINPAVKWMAALIAGGGVAAAVQGGTVLTRAFSTAATGGVGNPLVASAELAGSLTLVLLAILIPIAGVLIVLLLLVIFLRLLLKRRRRLDVVVPA